MRWPHVWINKVHGQLQGADSWCAGNVVMDIHSFIGSLTTHHFCKSSGQSGSSPMVTGRVRSSIALIKATVAIDLERTGMIMVIG